MGGRIGGLIEPEAFLQIMEMQAGEELEST